MQSDTSGKTMLGLAAMLLAISMLTAQPYAAFTADVSNAIDFQISKYVPAEQTFSVSWTYESADSTYYLVSPSGGKQLLFSIAPASNNSYTISLLNDNASVIGVLASQESNSTLQVFDPAAAKPMEGYIQDFNSQRGLEHDCFQYTGNLNSRCMDYDSCFINCNSVTSLCGPQAQGSGRDFINSIVDYNLQVTALDNETAAEPMYYSAMANDPSGATVDAYLSHISRILVLSANLSQTPLNSIYAFCPTPKYDTTNIIVKRDEIYRMRSASSDSLSLKGTASKIAQSGKDLLASNSALGQSVTFSPSSTSVNPGSGPGQAANSAQSRRALSDFLAWANHVFGFFWQ